jgi:hypothetical protein
MNANEKKILKALVEHPSGLLSPADFINGVAAHDKRAVANLVSEGYVEEVPQEIGGGHHGSYSLNFYRATKEGLMQFAPRYRKIWYDFKNEIALYVGIFSIILGLVGFTSNVIFSYIQNARSNEDFQLRNRPYLVISHVDKVAKLNNTTQYIFHIKNVGILPAKITGGVLDCGSPASFNDKNLIGNGEEVTTDFNVAFSQADGHLGLTCMYSIPYTSPSDIFKDKAFETLYTFKILSDSGLQPIDASLK